MSNRNLFLPAVIACLFTLGFVAIGAAIYFVWGLSKATGAGDAISVSLSFSGSNREMFAGLRDYARSIGTEERAPAADLKMLPDVNTMIERLATRLETTPKDTNGWRMLGWSYFQTGHHREAVTAYARAVELDPNSAELKRSYEEARKATEGDNPLPASSSQAEAHGKGDDGSGGKTMSQSHAMPPHERDAAIRSMVNGLADRLERSPRDVEGWARLMRSRVVLGERDAAATAFRKALEVFTGDVTATGEITASAIELGLNVE